LVAIPANVYILKDSISGKVIRLLFQSADVYVSPEPDANVGDMIVSSRRKSVS